jgi:hypothetical protein
MAINLTTTSTPCDTTGTFGGCLKDGDRDSTWRGWVAAGGFGAAQLFRELDDL